MHSNTSGPLTTFLLFVPLVAVPLLAVFGIPQFAPVVASPGADEVAQLGDVVIEDDSARQSSPSRFAPFPSDDGKAMNSYDESPAREFSDPWNDPFHPPAQPAQREHGHSVAAASGVPWVPPAEALDEWEPDPISPPKTAPDAPQPRIRANFDEQRQLHPEDRHPDAFLPITDSRRQSPFDDNPFTQLDTAANHPFNPKSKIQNPKSDLSDLDMPPARFVKDESIRNDAAPNGSGNPQSAIRNLQSEEPLTWPSAVRRLKELDICHFQLEPGERDEFNFSCYFTPSDNPRITHRFEAEATEPLQAVEKVLAQVEQWLEKR